MKKNSISINVYPPHPQERVDPLKKVGGMMPPHLRIVVVDYYLPMARQGWDWQSRLGKERWEWRKEGTGSRRNFPTHTYPVSRRVW